MAWLALALAEYLFRRTNDPGSNLSVQRIGSSSPERARRRIRVSHVERVPRKIIQLFSQPSFRIVNGERVQLCVPFPVDRPPELYEFRVALRNSIAVSKFVYIYISHRHMDRIELYAYVYRSPNFRRINTSDVGRVIGISRDFIQRASLMVHERTVGRVFEPGGTVLGYRRSSIIRREPDEIFVFLGNRGGSFPTNRRLRQTPAARPTN